VICFTEVRFLQTYSPLRWSQRPSLFQPFPSLKRSPRPSELLFSINRDTKSPQGPPHNWCLLPWLQLSWKQERRNKKSNPSARAQMNTSISLSLVTIWLEWPMDLGEDLISLYVSWMKSIALVWGVKTENLDAINGGWLEVFIAPTTKGAVGGGCCRMAHRTVRCASHVTPPLGSDRWSFWQLGHRTVRWCIGQSLFTVRCAFWLCSDFCAHCSALTARCRRPLALCSLYSTGASDSLVLHWTVRWIIAERLPEFPKVASLELGSLVHRTVRCARPGHTSVVICSFYLNLFLVFLLVCCEPLAPVELIIYSKLVSPINLCWAIQPPKFI
jgi:hypothetical protein